MLTPLTKLRLMSWLCGTLYAYLDDQHIQTALNKIVKPLA